MSLSFRALLALSVGFALARAFAFFQKLPHQKLVPSAYPALLPCLPRAFMASSGEIAALARVHGAAPKRGAGPGRPRGGLSARGRSGSRSAPRPPLYDLRARRRPSPPGRLPASPRGRSRSRRRRTRSRVADEDDEGVRLLHGLHQAGGFEQEEEVDEYQEFVISFFCKLVLSLYVVSIWCLQSNVGSL